MSQNKATALYLVYWHYVAETEQYEPRIHAEEVFVSEKFYSSKGKYFGADVEGANMDVIRIRQAFKYRAKLKESERRELLVGLTPQEAIELALELATKQRQRAMDDLERHTHTVIELQRMVP